MPISRDELEQDHLQAFLTANKRESERDNLAKCMAKYAARADMLKMLDRDHVSAALMATGSERALQINAREHGMTVDQYLRASGQWPLEEGADGWHPPLRLRSPSTSVDSVYSSDEYM